MPDDGSSSGWHQFPDWPPPWIGIKRLYFAPGKLLSDTANAQTATLTWTVNAEDTASDPASGKERAGVDQAPMAKPYRLALTTQPLTADTVIAGSAEANLKVAFSSNGGNLVARLIEVGSDGSVNQISTGC
jgi:predicted acyl esterase